MRFSTQQIIQQLNSDFSSVYKSAAPFASGNPLWFFCMDVIADPTNLHCIVFANELEIPPVRSLLVYYKRQFSPDPNFEFSNQESQWLGALMAYLFKNILGFQSQKERNKVNLYGIGTATRYYDGPAEIIITSAR